MNQHEEMPNRMLRLQCDTNGLTVIKVPPLAENDTEIRLNEKAEALSTVLQDPTMGTAGNTRESKDGKGRDFEQYFRKLITRIDILDPNYDEERWKALVRSVHEGANIDKSKTPGHKKNCDCNMCFTWISLFKTNSLPTKEECRTMVRSGERHATCAKWDVQSKSTEVLNRASMNSKLYIDRIADGEPTQHDENTIPRGTPITKNPSDTHGAKYPMSKETKRRWRDRLEAQTGTVKKNDDPIMELKNNRKQIIASYN